MNDGQGWFLEKQQQITERVGEPVLLVVKMTFETATFHVLTPYPGTALYRRLADQGRILHDNWDLYDTRHAVFRPAQMTGEVLERGYWQAYREFYRWGSIVRGARTKPTWTSRLRHVAYAGGWKKFEPLWDWLIRARRIGRMLPLLETVLRGDGRSLDEPAGNRSPERVTGRAIS